MKVTNTLTHIDYSDRELLVQSNGSLCRGRAVEIALMGERIIVDGYELINAVKNAMNT